LPEEQKSADKEQAPNPMQQRNNIVSEEQKSAENDEKARNHMQEHRAGLFEEDQMAKLESHKANDSEYYHKQQAFQKALTIGIIHTIMEENTMNVKAPSQPLTQVTN